ncbi:conjugative transposon protein TraN [Pontibacter sp. 172403-2]|uniref:conjugative transposon protein TraN n=1 Tax=Pontibacter rufus TaxID=2791028 RepID=UPI0018AFE6DD|nr:conjugative transposon protein TraN [Pontibacter sp. 172403-2]MBF9252127.1 conjugative transposon protein TraN [Pontibacter sp. 172403-2]
MKTICAVMITGIFLVLTNINAYSQNAHGSTVSVIEPYPLAITYFKTTNLMFPYAIKSVDRGSKDVLAQKATGVENILQVKAGKRGFNETNLTVITADGKLYSYVLSYADNPSVLNLQFSTAGKPADNTLFSAANPNEAVIQEDAKKVAAEKKNVRGVKDKKYGIKFRLNGLFIRDDVMYYQIKVTNKSNINYGIDQLRFFIRDQKKPKRSATQEIEIKPLDIQNDASIIAGQSERILVFALPKFTIPDKKYLAIQLMEKNGGRHLELDVHNKTIIKAQSL